MLHIVQVVFAGRVETPRVFLDQAEAEAAFVAHVKTFWKQSYSAYCGQHGIGTDEFSSAEAFLDTLDMSEKGRINYWVVSPDDAPGDNTERLDWLGQRRKEIENSVRQVGQQSAVVREGLTALLDGLAELTECFAEKEHPSAETRTARPVKQAASVSPTAEQEEKEEPEGAPEKYSADEWKAFVGAVMNVCGGGRSESSLFTRHDWRQDVYSNATTLEYWDWAATKVAKCREKAEKAGYDVIRDPDSPGDFKIKNPQGTVDNTPFYSELDAWCHAGMNMPE